MEKSKTIKWEITENNSYLVAKILRAKIETNNEQIEKAKEIITNSKTTDLEARHNFVDYLTDLENENKTINEILQG